MLKPANASQQKCYFTYLTNLSCFASLNATLYKLTVKVEKVVSSYATPHHKCCHSSWLPFLLLPRLQITGQGLAASGTRGVIL